MIEKLKLEPYIQESLVVHVYEKDGTLVAERYDTIYWARDKFSNVKCSKGVDCYVEAKIFCTLAPSIKEVDAINVKDKKVVQLTLFNGAKYDLDMVDGNLPTFTFPDLKNKTAFDFGGVESAVCGSPLQKELNTVFVDEHGAVASSSIVGGVCSTKFKSKTPFAVPEGIHSMVNGNEAEWDIDDGKLYVRFGSYEIVAILPKLPEFAWWDATRSAFAQLPEFVQVKGLRSSVSRLSNFGSTVVLKGKKIEVNKDHWEPLELEGSGETFDIGNLMQILVDEEIGVALVGGNLFLKTKDSEFVCCSVDITHPE